MPAIAGGLRNPRNCAILDSWAFANFILADELFANALRSFETCLSLNSSLFKKLISSLQSPLTFDERFKDRSVAFFILYFNLLSLEWDNFTLELLYWFILYWYYIKRK